MYQVKVKLKEEVTGRNLRDADDISIYHNYINTEVDFQEERI